MGIYKMAYLPTLLYGSESWTVFTEHESMITGAGMRYLRKCSGGTRRDRIRNSHIRGILNQEPVTKMVGRRELRLFGHLISMDSNRKPGQIWGKQLKVCWEEEGQGQKRKSICGS
jgi:hypothetical protein